MMGSFAEFLDAQRIPLICSGFLVVIGLVAAIMAFRHRPSKLATSRHGHTRRLNRSVWPDTWRRLYYMVSCLIVTLGLTLGAVSADGYLVSIQGPVQHERTFYLYPGDFLTK